jgi:assimilatory nitrate reductase catalytic subunit
MAIAAGAEDVAALGQATRAGTGCGTCKVELERLLREPRRVLALA